MLRPVVSDEELLWAWQRHDEAAGQALFKRHFDQISRYFVTKVGAGADADDLVQTTFLACTESSLRFEGRSAFRTFLLGIAHKVLLKYVRRRYGPGSACEPSESSVLERAACSSAELARGVDQARLLDALRELPRHEQTVIGLYYWEERTPSDPNPATRRAFGSNSTGSLGVRLWLPVLPSAPACAP